MSPRVLIVGSVAFDDISTPKTSVQRVLGGSAVYGSVAASHFVPVDIVGVVGDDFPEEHIEELRRRDIDTRGLEIVKGGQTFHWGGEYFANMNDRETHFTRLGVFEDFKPAIPEPYKNDEYIFLANIDPQLQLTVLDQIGKTRLTILDSMNLWIDIQRDPLLEVLSRVDVAMLNDAEAQ